MKSPKYAKSQQRFLYFYEKNHKMELLSLVFNVGYVTERGY